MRIEKFERRCEMCPIATINNPLGTFQRGFTPLVTNRTPGGQVMREKRSCDWGWRTLSVFGRLHELHPVTNPCKT